MPHHRGGVQRGNLPSVHADRWHRARWKRRVQIEQGLHRSIRSGGGYLPDY